MRLILFLVCLFGATTLRAEGDSRLKALETGDATRGWEAVGRIDMGYGSFCTGALIAPDTVLTAAHCLYDSDSGTLVPVENMEFRAGWRNGRAEAYRGVRRAVAHPDYDFGAPQKVTRVASDLALLQLDAPIRSSRVKPFETSISRLRRGTEVTIVSYAQHRSEAPSLQQVCRVLESYGGVGMFSCSVDFGASGAPIFVMEESGPQIVSVVAAKAEANGEPVALAGELQRSLEVLQEQLVATPVIRLNRGSRLSGSPDSDRLGAKFVRP